MMQSSNSLGSWQSISADLPEIHETLQQIARAIYVEKKGDVSVDQQKIQVEQAIALGFLKQQEDKIAFAESALQADYLAEYAVNQLVSTWDDIDIFLDVVNHLYHCSVLLKYNLDLGAQSLCTLAKEHNKDLISRIIEVATLRSTEDVAHQHFWHLHELFCAALPNLCPKPKPLADALEVLASINLGAAKLQDDMKDLLKQSQETVEAFYQEFISRSNPLFTELVFTTLLILSRFDFDIAHQRALSFTNSSDLVKVDLGLSVLGRLDYFYAQQSELLAITLARFNEFLLQHNTKIDSILAKAYGDLLDQSDEAITNFVELSSRSDLAVRKEAAQVLLRRSEKSFQEDWYRNALSTLLHLSLLHPEILERLDFAIRHYVHSEPSFAVQLIKVLALNWDYANSTYKTLPDVVSNTLTELFNCSPHELNVALTHWFASKIPCLHRAASEIEHFFASIPSNNPNESADSNLKPSILLSKSVLDSLDEITVQQMLYRIAGYVIGGISLSALILSAAQREPISQSLAELIVMLLSNIIYDYPIKAKEYLNNRLGEETTTEVEKQIIQAALERFDRYFQSRKSLPFLKELQAPPSRIYAYYQAQWKQDADIAEQAKKRSIFGAIFSGQEIQIKYGKASAHFDNAAQKVSEPMRFSPLSYEYDIPQSDVINPVGRDYQCWRWKLIGLEQIMDTFKTDSVEPEV